MKLIDLIKSKARKMGIPHEIAESVFEAADRPLIEIIGVDGILQNAYDLIHPNFEPQDFGILVRDTQVLATTEKAFRIAITNKDTGIKSLYWVAKSLVKIIGGRHVIPAWVINDKRAVVKTPQKEYIYKEEPHLASIRNCVYDQPAPWL